MSNGIEMFADDRIDVSVGQMTELAVTFTKEYAGKGYSAHEIIVLALMNGIDIGYRAAKDAA